MSNKIKVDYSISKHQKILTTIFDERMASLTEYNTIGRYAKENDLYSNIKIAEFDHNKINSVNSEENLTVFHIFSFTSSQVLKIRKLFELDISIVIGLLIPKNTIVPIHRDALLEGNKLNIVLSGSDSETRFYNDDLNIIMRITGTNNYYFSGHKIIHDAVTKTEMMKICQINLK